MEKKKHIPVRTCIGCGQRFPQNELLRIVLNTENELNIDHEKRLSGRGAYLCRNEKCQQLAIRKRGLNRAYRKQVEPAIHEKLKSIFNE